jgi:DNA repair protein RAD57
LVDAYSGGFKTVKDLILANPPDIARALKISLDEINSIVDKVSEELEQPPIPLSEAVDFGVKFTTGDKLLDQALGGGIRTGLLWEFCGER